MRTNSAPCTAVTDEPSFDLLRSRLDSTRLAFLVRGNPWKLAMFAFAGYYLAPLLVTASCGALLSPARAQQQMYLLGYPSVGLWMSSSKTMLAVAKAGGSPFYYASDIRHLFMAIVTVLIGTALTIASLQRYSKVFQELVRSGQLGMTHPQIEAVVERANQRRGSIAPYLLFAIASLLMTTFMVDKAFDGAHVDWWGHSDHGPAGVILGLAAGAMVFCGASAVYLLAVGLQVISEMFKYPVTLRPFHPDGCNGFAVFGDFLIVLFLLSVALAMSISITIFGGYLGVEDFVGTWVIGTGILATIPLILITPLVRCTIQIGRAKHDRLARVEAILNKALQDIENDISDTYDPETLTGRVEHLLKAKKAMSHVYGPYNFPFKPRLVGALSVTYAIQVVLIMREAVEKFR